MKCESAQRKLALHVTGDLIERDAQRVDAHIRNCIACDHYRLELMAQLNDLSVLREPDTPELDVARIVERGQRASGFEWIWGRRGVVVALILLAFAVGMLSIPEDEPEREVTMLTKLSPAEFTIGDTTRVDAPQLEVVPAVERETPEASTLIKLYTDDPDVVIYWFGD